MRRGWRMAEKERKKEGKNEGNGANGKKKK